MFKGIKGIIFDFDGVIVESVEVKTNAFAALYSENGIDVVQKVVNHHQANGGMSRFEKIKYYHKTFLNINLNEKEITDLAHRFSTLVIDKVIEAPYVPGALDYITSNYKKYKLFISTGTPYEEIRKIIKSREIATYFTDVYGSPNKKQDHIKDIRIKYNLNNDEILFIGDAKTDIEAAAYYNIEFVLRIHKYNRDYFNLNYNKVIRDFSDMEKLEDKFNKINM